MNADIKTRIERIAQTLGMPEPVFHCSFTIVNVDADGTALYRSAGGREQRIQYCGLLSDERTRLKQQECTCKSL